jgi:hypothetical protein
MTVLNPGVALLNHRPLHADEPAVFCVLGTAGGGTSMTARLLEAAGIFMGENLKYNAEDPQFVRLLKDEKPDGAVFRKLIAQRNAAHRRWGFKSPFRFHWDLVSQIANVRYVVVFRDILAAGTRSTMASGANPLATMSTILSIQKDIVTSISSSRRPILMFSYEKALSTPSIVLESILEFAGAEASESAIVRLKGIVSPNDPIYVAARPPIRPLR